MAAARVSQPPGGKKAEPKRTYFPYEGGISPEQLRIGGLYLDPLNPNTGLAARRFEYREKYSSIDVWKIRFN
jgi:hypothetical protein